ncbi:hypothetical protein [Enterococcus sp. AZ126]|uniref:hypothetical protein n=1 Tax=Enterococcus sp. AZ126 TaxID=2774635 RepID=UPI003F29C374
MEKKLENVWNRREEANRPYRDAETFELKEGYHFEEIKKICKEEGVTIEEFMKYAQDRAKNEVEK